MDDEMAAETRELTWDGPSGGRTADWHDPEPAGEDQPEAALVPELDADRGGGAPSGMTARERDARSRLGRYLRRSVFPTEREQLIREARQARAPDDIVATLHHLPAEEKFRNVADVWAALRHKPESELEQRF